MSRLFEPLKIGALQLNNRIIMAPLTRARNSGEDQRTPNALMTEYYRQRATAGLIISEATSVNPMGVGYDYTPGIWSEAQIKGWSEITQAVHAEGGKIVLQLWHVGRISHQRFLNGAQPVAPTAIAAVGHVSLVRPPIEYPVPRALEISEIKQIVEDYRKGAANAKLAGFDGVEIHGANGYLIDQFLQDGSNHRTDEYGGSIQNRARFLLEVTDAVISVWGADRVGMHLAPRSDSHSISDSDGLATFSYVATELGKRKIAFICAREHESPNSFGPKLKKLFGGTYIVNEGFTQKTAEQIIERGDADAVAFGKYYIANPDLVKRFELHAKLNELDSSTMYGQGAKGYSDYAFMDNSN